jgi:glucose-6-phosphate-specific signal transduction histidine kinase
MQLTPAEISSHGYRELERLEHMELVPFVKKYIRPTTWHARAYFALNILLFTWIVYWFTEGILRQNQEFSNLFLQFSYGLTLSILLIPIHEWIHMLAYRLQGARTSSMDVNWKKFYFMAVADQFVASAKEFRIVALAPFTIISISLLAIFFFVPYYWQLTLLSCLFAHTAMCSGDFALLSFFETHSDKEVITYDDHTNKISYFFVK